MCGCSEMESFEEFCLRSLALLQEQEQRRKEAHAPLCSLKMCSVIHFHGRAVLSPLLNAEQLREMCGYKQRAIQIEEERQNRQKNKLPVRVHAIPDEAQIFSKPVENEQMLSRPISVSGYKLVTDSPRLPKDPGYQLQTNDQPPNPCPNIPISNGFKEEEKANTESQDKSDEDDEEDEEDISLDSLLKKSGEYVKRDQKEHEPKAALTIPQSPPQRPSPVQAEKNCSPVRDSVVEFGFSLQHSPGTPPQARHQVLRGSNSQMSGCLSTRQSEPYSCLRSPESAVNPQPQRRKPRPVSTGNLHISFPIGSADLMAQCTGRPCEGAGVLEWGNVFSGVSSSSHCGSLGMDGVDCTASHRSSHCVASPTQDTCSFVSASMPTSMGPQDTLTTGFRRRCHTLDNHARHSGGDHIDRSQERVPRFMAGVTWVGPSRRSQEVQINQSYDVENPSPYYSRASMTAEMSAVTTRREADGSRRTPNIIRNNETPMLKTDETQWRSQALGDMRKRLEEEHALQMSVLLTEQKKEQQRLSLELDGAERGLLEQGSGRPLSGDSAGWSRRSVNDSRPIMSPSCPGLSPIHTPPERPLVHNIGTPSPIPSGMSSPSFQHPDYSHVSVWGAGKPRARSSLVWTAEQLRACCRISAIVRGFLTRRLLKIEKVKHLQQTIRDTQEFIRAFQTEALQRRSIYSAQDLSLQERVRAQLRAALFDIHDIFFEMPLCDRLSLLQQDRELRNERKLRDLEKAKCSKEKVGFSAATQRSLDRKKRIGESPLQVRKMQPKSKSPTTLQPTNRALKPSQGQNSSAVGQLNRQGWFEHAFPIARSKLAWSWNKKTPEERVKRVDNLKKQHSLG